MDSTFLQDWEVHAQYSMTSLGYDLVFYRKLPNGTREFLQFPDGPCIIKSVPPNTFDDGVLPTVRLGMETIQNLVEAVQRSGVQPKAITKIEGQYQAQGEHLSDLRKILRKQGVME